MRTPTLSVAIVLITALPLIAADQANGVSASASNLNPSVTVVDHGAISGIHLSVRSVNNHGAIVGGDFSADASAMVPFLWTPRDGFQKILGETPGIAVGINEEVRREYALPLRDAWNLY